LMGGLVFLCAVLALQAPQVQVSTVDGGQSAGELQNFGAGHIELKTDQGNLEVPLDQILSVLPQKSHPTSAEKSAVWIELVDGSKLTASNFTVDAAMARLTLGSGRIAKISTSAIHSVRFSPPDDSNSPAWPENVGSDASGDLLAVRKKDQIDFMEGSLGDVSATQVNLKLDGQNYPVNRAKVDGLIYFHKAADDTLEPLCVVETTDGWHLKVKKAELKASASASPSTSELEVTTLSGDAVTIPWDIITRLDFSAGKIAYLSDLEPASTQWTSYFDLGKAAPAMAQYYSPRRDEGREHQPLRLDGKTYNKGMALYSRTTIDYHIPAGMKKFKATVGIDDAVRNVGTVRLKIAADGKSLFDGTVSGKDAPVDLDLNIAGAKRLSILVDYGDQSDAGDYLDLADARMLK
jgi:hypothetical protein